MKMLRKVIAVVAVLATAENAFAGNILRRGAAPNAATAPADAAQATAAAAARQASEAAQNAQGALRKALDTIKQFQVAQDAARAAARAASSAVPDGLGAGGLVIAPGVGQDPSLWQGAALPTQVTQDGRTAVTVTQKEEKAILTWATFNVGKGTDLVFDQKAAGGDAAGSWIVLNRVLDPSTAPSRILGSIKADGQVYVLNRNGILFGGTSQVNVGTLVASSLEIFGGDSRFRAGLLSQGGVTFGGDGVAGGAVVVEAGARLSVGNYGQALLLGGQVANHGTVEAPDGQVLLAAGSGVSLIGSTTPNLRGYRLSAPVADGGSVENNGIIATPRGNVTLAGDSVRQGGLLTATSSGEASGSIYLGQAGGTTTFAEGSVTQVLPDDDAKKVVGGSPKDFQRSEINVSGERITLLGDSRIYAPSGNVSLSAQVSPGQIELVDGTRIYVDKGASIDVSGLRDVEIAMEQNTIEAQLRANELRDNPLLRDSPGLRGRTVWFDPRLGVNVADLSGYYGLVPRGVKEFMTQGGTVSLAANETITREGSTIDLSGGSLRYLDGFVTSSILVDAAGSRVRIEDARKDVKYVGLAGDFVEDHSRWGVAETFAAGLTRSRPHFEAGYVEGSSAGTLNVTTNGLPSAALPDPHPTGDFRIFDGVVLASTVVGPKQREMPSGSTEPTQTWRERPAGATLNLDRAGNVTVGAVGSQLPAGFGPDGTLDGSKRYEHVLPAAWFDGHTFSNVSIKSAYTDDRVEENGSVTQVGSRNLAPGGNLTIGRGVVVDLGDGGSFSFSGKRADIEGTLQAAGGSVSITALDLPAPDALAAGARPTVHLGTTGTIDVAGRWSNDRLDGVGVPLRALHGGGVTLRGQDVILEGGSLIDVSGGGRLNAPGSKVTGGNGGSITLDVSRPTLPVQPQLRPVDGRLQLGGTLSGYALGKGGSLSLVTPYDISITDALPAPAGPSTRVLTPGFFTHGGFSSYAIVGERSVTVATGTMLSPTVETLVLPGHPEEIASGSRVADVATRRVLDEGLRAPMSLSLSTVPVRGIPNLTGDTSGYTKEVVVEEGATIRMTPGSTVQLASVGTVYVDGTIDSPGGAIQLTGRSGEELGGQMDALGVANVRLGAHAELLAAGYEKGTLDGNLIRRSVEPGGAVTLSAPHEVLIDPGAVIDVHGIRGTADLDPAPGAAPGQERYSPVLVDGNAGSISINAATGVLAGQFRLSPGGETGHGGTLAIGAGSPVVVRQDAPAWFLDLIGRAGVTRNGSDRGSLPGTLTVVADAVNGSGADDLILRAASTNGGVSPTGQLLFEGNVDLHTRRSLTLGFPQIGTVPGDTAATVDLESRFVALTGGTSAGQPAPFATDLRGGLTVRAEVIDISNSVWLGCSSIGCPAGGFEAARFIARGDIRLSDHDTSGAASTHAGLFSNGAITFESAQVYPTRLLNPADPGLVPGFLVQSDVAVTVTGNGNATPVPLSYGESLTLRAPVIVQGGVIRAPQGQIRLEGTGPDGSVTLLPGSLTSASLEGLLVPFGAVATGGSFTGYDRAGQAPEKSVRLDAPDVAVQPGAVIDVSGRGDLLGHVFVPGNGGSRDILSSSGGFAVLPSLTGAVPAPAGGSGTLQDSRLHVGDSVWLQGVPGLVDGFYTLLPAHYALLPGGMLVQPLGGSLATAPASSTRDDGAAIVSGYRAVAGTSIRDQGYGRFLVMARDVFEKYSDVQTYSFDAYAQGLAASAGVGVRTPNDAGSVVLAASRSLTLDGVGHFEAGPEGLLGNLDVSAPKIAVVGSGVSAPAPGDGYLVLRVEALENFGAGSVLLGGTRSAATDPSQGAGTAVTVNASEVVVDTEAASPWTGQEILLAATGSVSVKDGSVIQASGPGSRDTNALLLQGQGALLRLSTGSRVAIVRTAPGLGPLAAGTGILSVGNASLSAEGSLSLYGSSNIEISPKAILSGRQFDLASTVVNLGNAPADAAGTTLGVETMTRLASSADLLVRGTESIHVFGDLALGGRDGAGQPTLRKITFDTGLLQGEASSPGGAKITAGEFTLRNSGGGTTGSAPAGAGALTLDVVKLVLGPGQFRLAGYQALQGKAGIVEAQGTGSLAFAGDVALTTDRIQATSGASYAMEVGGALSLVGGAGASQAPEVKSLGGSLSMAAASIALDTAVVLPAGTFEATAHSGAVEIGPNGSIDVSGRAVDFRDQVRFAPGGIVRLRASGDITVASGAILDVSGSSRGGNAGRVEVSTGGTASIQGDLRGSALPGGAGGSFTLDAARAGTASDLSALNGRLESGGLDGLREIRLRQQDVTLGASDAIHAHDVELRSDSGRVTVAGEITASGTAARPDGGTIHLVGGGGVAVEGTARLDVRAGMVPEGGFEPASGKVEVVATGGRVDVAPGAVIDAGGGRQGGGSVVLRAAREGADLAIDRLGADIRGAREVDVIGVAGYQASVVDASLVDRTFGEASTWLQTGRDQIRARLGGALPELQVGSGMVVTSGGDLTVQADVDLSRMATRTPGVASGPGYLGFVAPGKIVVLGMVSDGFASAARDAALSTGKSFSYGFESGGDTVLGQGAMVRTGTGDVSVRSGRDLVLTDRRSVIYTAGARTGWASGFGGGPTGMPIGSFATQGGDIDIRAGRDVVAPLAAQSTSAWLYRYGDTEWKGLSSSSTVKQQASWSIVHGNFEQAVGALGGGNVRVDAGRDVVQLQVAIPTTGQLTTPVGGVARDADLVFRGGGDLDLSAGRDLLGGLFVIGRGSAELQVGGRAVANPGSQVALRTTDTGQVLGSSRPVGALFGLMDATAKLTAGSTVEVEGVFDPMSQGQLSGSGGNVVGSKGTAFMGYSERASLDATSTGGSITYKNDPWASVDLSKGPYQVRMSGAGSGAGIQATSLNSTFSRAPGILRLASLTSSAWMKDPFTGQVSQVTLASAPSGTVEVLARDDVHLLLAVNMEGDPTELRRGALQPFSTTGDVANLGTVLDRAQASTGRIHAGDPDPARIIAMEGSVCAYRSGSCVPDLKSLAVQVNLLKPLDLYAGKDVMAGDYRVRGDATDALSRIEAGRDVYDVVFAVGGSGGAGMIEAGRDVILHLSGQDVASANRGRFIAAGDPTRGNTRSSDLYVVAGRSGGVDLDGFAKAYLDPANAKGVVRTYLPELREYMKGLGVEAVDDAALFARFQALPAPRREVFLDRVYFTELRETGIDYNAAQGPRYHSYDRGFLAVSLMFPGDPALLPPGGLGSVLLDGKVVETQAAGDISVLAPYGRIAVGTELADPGGKGGIVTRRGGSIDMMSDRNIDLYTSRVFTLQGGDILMWTSDGSITAGSGAKTSVFHAPLRYTISADGVVQIDTFGLQTGAGIGVLDALQNAGDRPRSRLDLVAPKGEVNAGDAGIRVVGDLNIAAQVVVGVENIQATGASQGVPKVEAPNIGALTSASQLTQAATKEGVGPEAAARTRLADLPSIITVEAVGYETQKQEGEQDDK